MGNNELFAIVHLYDVDGGFGDAISKEQIIGYIDDEKLANKYVKKWSNPHVYDSPYDSLYCGKLEVRKVKINNLDIHKKPKLNY